MFKVIVLDLDGTLTTSKKEISPATKEALIKAQQSGVRIVLASGRPVFGMVPLAKELELEKYGGFILPFNGGKILDCQSGKIVYELNFPNEFIPKVYKYAKENKLTIISYDDEQIISENPEDEYVQKESFINHAPIKKVDNLSCALPPTIPKCLILSNPSELEVVEKKMQTEFGQYISVYRSEPYFLELLPKGIDKAASLERLAAHLGITSNEMIACGDGLNDLSMIKYAGLGVAMANAQPVVKEAADFITTSNDEDGIVLVVEKYILKKD